VIDADNAVEMRISRFQGVRRN